MEKFPFLSFCPMAVAHPTTNQSQRCLTSVISRELVCQLGYTALRLNLVALITRGPVALIWLSLSLSLSLSLAP